MPPKKKGGRYTPKGGPPPKAAAARTSRPASDATAGSTSKDPGRRRGRTPAPPWFLLLIGVLWVAVGFVIALRVEAAWRIVPALAFVIIGVLYLRAALNAAARRNATRWPDRGSRPD